MNIKNSWSDLAKMKMAVLTLGCLAVVVGLGAGYKYKHRLESAVIPPEEQVMVYGIVVADQAKAYHEKYLIQQLSLTEEVGGAKIRIINDEGTIIFQNLETNQEITPEKTDLTSWQAKYPDSELY